MPDTADDAGADGMRVDRDGRLYVATRMGIQVCDQAGRVNCIIPTPNGKIANLCFGGPNFDILFATCGDKVFKRKVKVQGANAFQAADQAARAPVVKRRSRRPNGGMKTAPRSGIVKELLNTLMHLLGGLRSGRLPSC